MGSCLSRSSGDGSDGAHLDDGRNAESNRNRVGQRGAPSSAQKPAPKVNLPLRPPTPLRSSPTHLVQHPPPWTHSLLQRERIAHFETEAELHPDLKENWFAVQLASERLLQGQLDEASVVLESVGITCPSGKFSAGKSKRDRIKGGLFDERGREYLVPAWCVVDPGDLVAEEEEEQDEIQHGEGGTGNGESTTWEGDKVVVSVRLATSNETLVKVKMEKSRPLRDLKQLVTDKSGMTVLRLTYRGRVLDGGARFDSCGYQESDVVNAQVAGN